MISRRARSTTAALCLFLAGWAPEASAQDTFNWNTDSNGSWHDGFNWDQGTAPNGVSDVVVISRPAANPTVSYTALSGARLVESLVSEEAIVLTGGSLEVLTNAEFIGSFTLMGGTLKGGMIVATSGIEVGSSQNSRVDGITLDGNLELTGSSDYLEVLNGLTLNGTANLSGYSSRLDFAGDAELRGEQWPDCDGRDGGVQHEAPGDRRWHADPRLDGDRGGGGDRDRLGDGRRDHQQRVDPREPEQRQYHPQPGDVHEHGHPQGLEQRGLSLKNDWDNNGTIELDSGRLYLYGDNATADLNQPSFVRVGASAVYLAGSLDNTGDTLLEVGTIDFIGGSVVGGTSNVDFNATSNMSEFADGVTLNADLNLTGSNDHFEIQNGLTLNGTANLSGYSSRLDFAGTQSFGASSGQTATVEMGEYNTKLQVTDGGTLTLDSTVTVVGEGTVTGSGTGDAIINNGLIHANLNNANIILSPETFTNTGTLRASNNGGLSLKNDWDNNGTIELDSGRLYLYGDNATADLNQPSFVRVGASAVYLAGSLDNTGDTLLEVGTIDFIGGSVVGGTSNVDFNATSNMSEFADGVTLNADLNLTGSNDHFEIQNGLTLNGTANLSGYSSRLDFAGTQSFGASSGQTATVEMGEYNTKLQVTDGGTLTLDSTVTVVGEGTVTGSGTGDAIINNGLIHANLNNANIILSPETFTNTGTLRASNNGGLSLKNDWDNNGTIELDSGRLYLYGDNATADLNQPSFVRVGASAVYLAGSLDNTGDTLLEVGTIDFIGGSVVGGTSNVDFNATSNMSEFADGVTLNADLNLTGSNDHFEIQNGLTLNGTANLSGYSSRLDFAGTQSFGASSGQTATVEMGKYNTKLQVTDGGTLTLDSTVTVVGEGTVTGSGTGDAIINNGLIHANLNNANIILSPETFTNTGTLRASNGARLALASGTFENHGVIEVLAGSQLVTTGLGAAGLEIETGASLGGSGSVIGNVTNTAGTVAPGATLGTLAITGDFFQESEGELSIELAGMTQGTESDFFDISGSATIDGVLRTSLLGGFMPDESDTFIILEADGGVFGTFSSVFDPGGNVWSVTYGATQVILEFEQAAVPEPGTHLLLGFGVLCLARRHRLSREPRFAPG